MQDQSAAKVLREILFDNDNKIDWNKAGNSIIENMPELKIFDQRKQIFIERNENNKLNKNEQKIKV